MDLLDRVLTSCEWLSQRASYVSIDGTRLKSCAQGLIPSLPGAMRHTPHHLLGKGEDTLAYFLILDAVNFGSGFFEYLRPYKGETGYFALAAAIRDWFVGDGVPDARRLTSITADAAGRILGQDRSQPLEPFLQWVATALGECGHFLERDLNGKYGNLLDLSQYSAPGMVERLCRMPGFRDIAQVDGQPVYILKRAQIFVHDYAIAAAEEGGREICDLDKLTIFSDNMIPFVLERCGVLRYVPELAGRIASGVLERGERAEVEIRANAVWACELICRELRAQGHDVTARELDYALWNWGESIRDDGLRPHLCRTPWY